MTTYSAELVPCTPCGGDAWCASEPLSQFNMFLLLQNTARVEPLHQKGGGGGGSMCVYTGRRKVLAQRLLNNKSIQPRRIDENESVARCLQLPHRLFACWTHLFDI